MLAMGIVLLVIYLLYFRADGGSYNSMLKVMRGLSSNTFNYLESNRHVLLIDELIPEFDISDHEPTTLEFFSHCVRFNRPCLFK